MTALGQRLPRLSASAFHKAAWAIALAAAAAYAAVFLEFSPLTLQDFPNHVARAAVIGDLVFHAGARFGQTFQYHFMAVPYILNDLLLGCAIELLGVRSAAAAWSLLVFLSLPFSLLIYMRSKNIRAEDQPLGFLLGLYLATNTCFFRGFLAYCLAVSVIVLALSLEDSLRQRSSPLRFASYCALLGIGYLIHLTTLIFIAAAVAVSTASRAARSELRLRGEVRLYLPIALLLIWHFVLRHSLPGPETADIHWGGIAGKLRGVDWNFIRFDRRVDRWMMFAALLCLFYKASQRRSPGAGASPHALDMLVLAMAFFGLYVVLPASIGPLAWVDVRALPMMAIFAVLACLVPADMQRERGAGTPVAFFLAAGLAAGNLVYIHQHLLTLDAWLSGYRSVVAAVPSGAWVLPVYTNTRNRPVKSTLHTAAYTVLDRDAPNPYLFSADLGNVMEYFSYRHRPYAPDENWYVEPAHQGVAWTPVADSYGFLLVMKPFDAARIPIEASAVFENSTAVLLAVPTVQRVSSTPLTKLNESKDFNPENTAHNVLPSPLSHLDGMRKLR